MAFTFVTALPPPRLTPFVELLWFARGRIPYQRERILPNGRPVLTVVLGDGFEMAAAADRDGVRVRRAGWISGPQYSFVASRPLGETHVLGATLRPAGAPGLLGVAASALTDRIVGIDERWRHEIERLRDRLSAIASPHKKIAGFAAFLQHMANARPAPPLVLGALGRLQPSAGLARIEALCNEFEVSRKHLAQLFRAHTGHTAKAHARILRFNVALARLAQQGEDDLAGLALQSGYYDQSHFNHDFSAFAGFSPGRYLALRRRHFGPGAAGETPIFVPIA